MNQIEFILMIIKENDCLSRKTSIHAFEKTMVVLGVPGSSCKFSLRDPMETPPSRAFWHGKKITNVANKGPRLNPKNIFETGELTVTPFSPFWGIDLVYPPCSNSHHQDHYMFSRES